MRDNDVSTYGDRDETYVSQCTIRVTDARVDSAGSAPLHLLRQLVLVA